MAIDIASELKRLYEQNKQRESSLSERLNQIDTYNGQVDPKVRGEMLDFSNRPQGYNPLNDIASAINYSEGKRAYRSAASEDFNSASDRSLSLLKEIDSMTGSGSAGAKEQAEAAALQRILGGKPTPTTPTVLKKNATSDTKQQEKNKQKQQNKPQEKPKDLLETATDFLFGATKKRVGDIDTRKKEIAKIAKSDPKKAEQMLREDYGSGSQLVDLITGQGTARKNLKATAELASFAVPFGKAGFIGSKAVVPGAITGGLQTASEEGATPMSVATGIGTGAALGGAVQGAGALIGGARKLVGKTPGMVSEKAAQGLGKATRSAHERIANEKGKDANKLIQQYIDRPVNGYDDILGPVKDKGKGGIFGEKMKLAEDQIQQTVKIAGSNIRLSGDDVIKALKKEATKISKELGGGTRKNAMKLIVKDAEKKYAKGASVKGALGTVRTANEKFGKAIVDDAGDAVVTAAQKLEANTFRELLKKRFPELKKALETQEDILTIRPLFTSARSTTKTQGTQLRPGAIKSLQDLINPMAWTEKAANNPAVASRMLQMGQGQAGGQGASKIPPGLLAKLAALGGSAAIKPGSPQQGQDEGYTQDETGYNNEGYDANSEINHDNSISDGVNVLTPEIMRAIRFDPDISTGMKAQFEKEWEDQQKRGVGGGGKKTEAQVARDEAGFLVDEALAAIEVGDVKTGPEAQIEDFKAMFNMASQSTVDFNTTISALKASIAKARAGTAFTPNEEKLLNKYTPNTGDSRQQIMTKLKGLQKMYEKNRGVQIQSNMAPLE